MSTPSLDADPIEVDYHSAEAQIRALAPAKRRRVRQAIRLRRQISRIERERLRPLRAKLTEVEASFSFLEETLSMRHALMLDLLSQKGDRR